MILESQFSDHLPQNRQAQAHHGVRVSVDSLDEGTTQTIDGERAGNLERFASCYVGLELGIGEVCEVNGGKADRPDRAAIRRVAVVDQVVPAEEPAVSTTHRLPACQRNLWVMRFAEGLTGKLEGGVTAKH